MNKNEILKKRNSNFTHTEVDLLQSLVTKYWDQLESKKSDTQTWKQKNACWEKLTDEFNSQNSVMENLSTNVLRKKWENCKKNVKSKVCNEKKYVKGTGGGPPIPTTTFSVYIYFLYNFYNYNNNYLLNLFLDLEASSWIDTVPEKSSSPDDDTVLKWDDYSPALLKIPVSKPLLITIPSDIYS
ncbi:uncharacterized protein LOC111028649, partial [Myzus persicae]|uniref:uncharacterized protein LOC111028649 n=1 Tax=Myzus persicae TaxID=13164 RepID=UPI000B930B06